MSAEDAVRTQQIASQRIHIERAINKIKNVRIWNGVFLLVYLVLLTKCELFVLSCATLRIHSYLISHDLFMLIVLLSQCC